jgi:hypothetical protein
MTWFVRKNAETVEIFDALDSSGNGNIRYRGTIDNALTMLAFHIDDGDHLRKRVAELEDEVSSLKTQLMR